MVPASHIEISTKDARSSLSKLSDLSDPDPFPRNGPFGKVTDVDLFFGIFPGVVVDICYRWHGRHGAFGQSPKTHRAPAPIANTFHSRR